MRDYGGSESQVAAHGARRRPHVGQRTEFVGVRQDASVGETAELLRRKMVDDLRHSGVIVSDAVYEAMRQIPRHLFLPGIDVVNAYADHAVMVKYSEEGTPLSSASQPTIVASMLEHLAVRSGDTILEIGTGTGYNAALLGHLAGTNGRVVTVEIEPDLAARAADCLKRLDFASITVVLGDGRLGYRPLAPFRRVIVTSGAQTVAPAWSEQLVEGGRLVVPVVDEAGVGTVVTSEKRDGEMVVLARIPCGFLPMRDSPQSPAAGFGVEGPQERDT